MKIGILNFIRDDVLVRSPNWVRTRWTTSTTPPLEHLKTSRMHNSTEKGFADIEMVPVNCNNLLETSDMNTNVNVQAIEQDSRPDEECNTSFNSRMSPIGDCGQNVDSTSSSRDGSRNIDTSHMGLPTILEEQDCESASQSVDDDDTPLSTLFPRLGPSLQTGRNHLTGTLSTLHPFSGTERARSISEVNRQTLRESTQAFLRSLTCITPQEEPLPPPWSPSVPPPAYSPPKRSYIPQTRAGYALLLVSIDLVWIINDRLWPWRLYSWTY
jgi:hypothetical protein